MSLQRTLRLSDSVLMILVAVVGLRWIASAAAGGPSSLVLWVLALVFFFIPEGLAVAELSSRHPREGGVYAWTKTALGDFHGFVCGWCYWVNNLFYFPGLLIFVSANTAFLFSALDPSLRLEEDKLYVTSLTLAILWLVALLNFLGMSKGRVLQNLGAVSTWIPVVLLIIFGTLAYVYFGSANRFDASTLTPRLSDRQQVSFFAEMCFAFAGLELISMMAGDIKNPARTITRAVGIAGIAIAATYMVGTAAVLVAVPQDQVTTINGILLPIETVAGSFGLGWVAALSAGLIALGGCGGTMAWFAGASRVPYVVGVDRYLPAAFGRIHPRRKTPHIAILAQTVVATAFTLIATAGAGTSVDTAYNILVDMCLILYFIPFVYLFLALIVFQKQGPGSGSAGFRIPGGKPAAVVAAVLGVGSTALAILMALLPPETGAATYLFKTVGGSLFMIGAGLIFYFRGRAAARQEL